MKGFIKVLLPVVAFAMVSMAWAGDKHTNTNKSLKWICETNASSSSNPADQKSDDMMKKAKSAKDAFEYAMKHCRDCTKITCNQQTTDQTNQTSSNQNMNNQNQVNAND